GTPRTAGVETRREKRHPTSLARSSRRYILLQGACSKYENPPQQHDDDSMLIFSVVEVSCRRVTLLCVAAVLRHCCTRRRSVRVCLYCRTWYASGGVGLGKGLLSIQMLARCRFDVEQGTFAIASWRITSTNT
ncbi:unnamed protein product, partial [Laminaria digitata]